MLIAKSIKYEIFDNTVYFVFLSIFALPFYYRFHLFLLPIILISFLLFNLFRKIVQIIVIFAHKSFFKVFSMVFYCFFELLFLKAAFTNNAFNEFDQKIADFKKYAEALENILLHQDYLINYRSIILLFILLILVTFILYCLACLSFKKITAKNISKKIFIGSILDLYLNIFKKSIINKKIISYLDSQNFILDFKKEIIGITSGIFLFHLFSNLAGFDHTFSPFIVCFVAGIIMIRSVLAFQAKIAKIRGDLSREIVHHLLAPGSVKRIFSAEKKILIMLGCFQQTLVILCLNVFDLFSINLIQELILNLTLTTACADIVMLFNGIFVRHRQKDSLFVLIGTLLSSCLVMFIVEMIAMTNLTLIIFSISKQTVLFSQFVFLLSVIFISEIFLKKIYKKLYGEFSYYAADM